MRGIVTALLLCLLLLPAAARAQGGALQAGVVLTDDVRFLEKWSESTLDALPQKQITDSEINRTFYIVFAAKNFALDGGSRCRLTADFVLRRPDGKAEMKHAGWPKLETTYLPGDNHKWVMLMSAIDLMFEETDPQGTWLIEGTVRDAVSGTSAKVLRELKLVQSEPR